MKQLKIIATIVAKEEYNQSVYEALTQVVDGTRTEAGSVYYALHRDIKNHSNNNG